MPVQGQEYEVTTLKFLFWQGPVYNQELDTHANSAGLAFDHLVFQLDHGDCVSDGQNKIMQILQFRG